MIKDYTVIAFKIINQIIRVRAGQVISINGEIRNGSQTDSSETLEQIPFIEELALAIRKKNAFPMLELSTERLKERFFSEVSEDVYDTPFSYYKSLIEKVDCIIDLGWRSNPQLFESIPDVKFNKMKKSTEEVRELIEKKHKKTVYLGFPTSALADYYNVNLQDLRYTYFESLNCDYNKLENSHDNVVTWLVDQRNIKLVSGNEYLYFQLESPVNLKDGIFRNQSVYLPAGKVSQKIISNTLNGTFAAEKVYFRNKVFTNIELMIKNGNVSMVRFGNESKGNVHLQNAFHNINTEIMPVISIGINKKIKPIGYEQYDRCAYGNISIEFVDMNSEIITISNCCAEMESVENSTYLSDILIER